MAVIGYFDSLTEVQRLVTDRLLAGIIEEIIEEGQLIPRLPVMQLDAKSLIYNREGTLPTADFYDIGEDIPAQAQATVTPITVTLRRVIGQWDLDNFIVDTYRDPNDIRAQAISMARKGVMRTIENELIYGDDTTLTKHFDGLHLLCPSAQHVANGSSSTGAALSLANLDKAIDLVKPKPDLILMNFEIWRRLMASGRGATPVNWIYHQAGQDVGATFPVYRDIPIVRSDYIVQTETISGGAYALKTTGACSSIFLVRFGGVEEGGLCLVTGNPMFEFKEIELENKDANRFRLTWYVNLALGSTKSIAVVDGITDAAITA